MFLCMKVSEKYTSDMPPRLHLKIYTRKKGTKKNEDGKKIKDVNGFIIFNNEYKIEKV